MVFVDRCSLFKGSISACLFLYTETVEVIKVDRVDFIRFDCNLICMALRWSFTLPKLTQTYISVLSNSAVI